MRTRTALPLALGLAAALLARPCAAQDRFRVGVVLGGLGFVGAVVEGVWDDRTAELLVSTFSFRDLSVSVAGKQLFGASRLKPALGAGVTWVAGPAADGGTGHALVARFPLGGDWQAAPGHFVTWEINVTRGLVVRRPDPTDDAPLTPNLLPFPSLSYRIDPGAL